MFDEFIDELFDGFYLGGYVDGVIIKTQTYENAETFAQVYSEKNSCKVVIMDNNCGELLVVDTRSVKKLKELEYYPRTYFKNGKEIEEIS